MFVRTLSERLLPARLLHCGPRVTVDPTCRECVAAGLQDWASRHNYASLLLQNCSIEAVDTALERTTRTPTGRTQVMRRSFPPSYHKERKLLVHALSEDAITTPPSFVHSTTASV